MHGTKVSPEGTERVCGNITKFCANIFSGNDIRNKGTQMR